MQVEMLSGRANSEVFEYRYWRIHDSS